MRFSCVRRFLAAGLACIMLDGVCLSGAVVGKITVNSETEASGFVQSALQQRVFNIIRTREGETFSEKVLNDDIKELTTCGSFDNVRVKRVPMKGGEVGLDIFVKPRPTVSGVEFRGNVEYSTSKLQSMVEKHLQIGQPLEERSKAAARKAVLEKYQNAGYFGTEVQTSEEKSGLGTVKVVVVVKEEKRFKLEGTYFKNATVFTEDELRDTIYTKRQWWRYIIRFGNYLNRNLFVMDKEALKKKYHNAGYLDFEVVEVKEALDETGEWVSLTYVLQEGKPYTVTDVKVVGAKRFSTAELEKDLKLTAGKRYNAAVADYDASLLKGRYGTLGYLDVTVWPVTKTDAEKKEVAVEYQIKEGQVVRIRDIKIVGNDYTKEKVIRRELAIQSDDLGNPALLEISRQRLMNLGYFSSVDIVPAVTENPDQRDLRIRLEERPTGNVSLGAAFSTEDSAMAQCEFVETNFDLDRLLAGEWPPKGGGQRFRSRIQLGSDLSNLVFSLNEPWFLDRRLSLNTEIFLRNRFEDEYDQRNIGAEVMLAWPFAFRVPFTDIVERNWRMAMGLRLEYIDLDNFDDYDESEWDPEYAEHGDYIRDRIIADEEDSYFANRLVWRITRDTRDRVRFPTMGSVFEFQTEYVTKALGSYEDYFRFSLSGVKYIPLPGERVVKIALGASTATGDDKVAIFDRYFGGGVGTVRGFDRRDISPVDRHEDPLGGNTILTGTVEVFQPIKDFMYASVFADFGNVWEDSFDMDSEICASVGVGVQFKALPISLYYGFPVTESYDHLDGKSGRFHFNIGFSY